MDILQAILDFFSVTSYKSDNSKKDKAVLFLIISTFLSIALLFSVNSIYEKNNILLIIVLLIIFSLILSILIILSLIKLKIIQPTNFSNFILYLVGLILLIGSSTLFFIDYFKIIN